MVRSRRIRCALFLPVFSIAAMVAGRAEASELAVQGAVTHSGDWAARVHVFRTCEESHSTIPNGTDYRGVATEEGCISLTAGDVDALPGADVTFRAGEKIVLGSGFSVASGASFRAVIEPEATGSSYVQSEHPEAETEYWARFYVLADALDLTGGESFLHFTASDAGGGLELAVGLKRNLALGENRVFLEAVEDGGGILSTEGLTELALPAGWHRLELRWRASTGADDGLAQVCIDDSPGGAMCAGLSALDNDTGRIESVRWGALNVPQGDLGTLYMDDLRAQLGGPIGACETEQECP